MKGTKMSQLPDTTLALVQQIVDDASAASSDKPEENFLALCEEIAKNAFARMTYDEALLIAETDPGWESAVLAKAESIFLSAVIEHAHQVLESE